MIDEWINTYARNNHLQPDLVKAIIKAESDFNFMAYNERSKASGLMQIIPSTAKDLGLQDPFNPEENIKAGCQYLNDVRNFLIKKFKEYHLQMNDIPLWMLAGYNWGIGNLTNRTEKKTGTSFVERFQGNYAMAENHLPNETRNYVKKIQKFYKKYKGE